MYCGSGGEIINTASVTLVRVGQAKNNTTVVMKALCWVVHIQSSIWWKGVWLWISFFISGFRALKGSFGWPFSDLLLFGFWNMIFRQQRETQSLLPELGQGGSQDLQRRSWESVRRTRRQVISNQPGLYLYITACY